MRTTRGWTGPRMAAVALTLGLLYGSPPPTRASSMDQPSTAIVDYNTDFQSTDNSLSSPSDNGTLVIPTKGVAGSPILGFNAVSSGNFKSPSQFSLGEYLVSPLPGNQSTTYTETPFQITLKIKDINGVVPDPNHDIVLTGKLNGTLTGPNQSSVVASFDPLTTPTFRSGDYLNTLTIPDKVLLVPSSNNGGRSTVQGVMTSEFAPLAPAAPTVPEPATVTIFLAAIAGYGLRRRLQRAALA